MTLTSRYMYSSHPSLFLTERQLQARDVVLDKLRSNELETHDVSCFCGHDDVLPIAYRDRYGLPVNTVLCIHCGLLRTSPRLSSESAKQFYERDYRSLYTEDPDPEHLFQAELVRGRHLVASLPSLVNQVHTVFEIGCGGGGLLLPFQEAGKKVFGCDLGGTHTVAGKNSGLDLITGTAPDLVAHAGRRADLVILSHVVEHFFDLRAELEAAIDAVTPGGFLFVEVPGIQTISSHYRGDLLLYLQNAHNYHFSKTTLSWVLESVGLYVVAADDFVHATAIRPGDWAPGSPLAPLPHNEHLSILSHLVQLEIALQKNRSDSPDSAL